MRTSKSQIRLGSTVNVDNRLFSKMEYNTKLVVIEITDGGYTLLTISNKPLFNIPATSVTLVH